MPLEENSEQIPSFTFIPEMSDVNTRRITTRRHVPVSPPENRYGAWDGVCLSCICFDADPACLGKAEEVIHDLKPLIPLRVVSTTDVNAALKLALRMIPQECKDGDNRGRGDVKREFVLVNRELLNKLGKALHKIGSVCVEGLGSFRMLDYRRIWGGGFGERRDGSWRNIKADYNMIPMGCSESHLWRMARSEHAWNRQVTSVEQNANRRLSRQAGGQHNQRPAKTLLRMAFGRVSEAWEQWDNQSLPTDSIHVHRYFRRSTILRQ